MSTTPPDAAITDASMEVTRGSSLFIHGRRPGTAQPYVKAALHYGVDWPPDGADTGTPSIAQCALARDGAVPSAWKPCQVVDPPEYLPFKVPVDTRIYRMWVRAYDAFGRFDPTPAESPPISPVPCTHRLLGRPPRTLRGLLHHTLRVSVTCLGAGRVESAIALTDGEANRLGESQILWLNQGRIKMAGGSVILRLRPTRFPRSVVRTRHLRLNLWSVPVTSDSTPGDAEFAGGIFGTRLLG